MSARFADKQSARRAVWDRLQAERLAVFPFPPHGRIPNFKGAREAARRLFTLPPWRDARAIKVNPDSPQAAVREEALRRGIAVYVPTPRLAGGFRRLDPARIPSDRFAEAAERANWDRFAEEVPLDALPHFDAIVVGSVAVTRDGRRAGKGAGYADLEYAILRELGHPPAPVATTVHGVQIVEDFPATANDLPLSAIATPEETVIVARPPPAPAGVQWERIGPDELAAMPVLRELLTRRPPSAVPPRR